MSLLGERIAQLFDTAPEPDPEDAFDDETIARNQNIDTGIDVDVHRSTMRPIDLGASYKGKVVSRDEIGNKWSAPMDDVAAISDDTGSESNELRVIPTFESDDELQKVDVEIVQNVDPIARKLQKVDDEFDTLFEDHDEEAGGIPMDQRTEVTEQTLRTLQTSKGIKDMDVPTRHDGSARDFKGFSSMMSQQMDKAEALTQSAGSLKIQKKPQTFQLRKAKAVAAQTKLFDKVATLRIHLQKPFQMAQKLPRPAVRTELFEVTEDDAQSARKRKLESLCSAVCAESELVAENVLNLQSKLAEHHNQYPAAWRRRKRRRLDSKKTEENVKPIKSSNDISWDGLWSELDADWSDLLPFCNETLDVWDRKMKLVEMSKHKKGPQQSMLERIATMIENPQRILSKMQSVDPLFKMYGDRDIEPEDVENEEVQDLEFKDELIRAGLKQSNVRQLQFAKDRMECEVFNDSAFYRRMLREIIDIGRTATLSHGELHKRMDGVEEKRRQRMEQRKVKCRLKYTIRPDMENFMAPIYDHDADFPVEQLYNSLFQ